MTYLQIAPSILAADFRHLGDAIQMINESEADLVHVDVMDGRFVPNISFGFPVLKAIKPPFSQKPLDVHLMIVQPEQYIDAFCEAGASILTVHYEACTHLHRAIQMIKANGVKAGVALNPHTPVHLLSDILDEIDLVCLMSVNPGFGGQKFIPHTLSKIQQLKMMCANRREDLLIEIDGGVSTANAAALVKSGANVLVAGSSVFKSDDPKLSIQQLKSSYSSINC